ncbi:unnamed protein product [Rotaria socialis]|uniref:Uncharacterized protein n=1 Tax=Rotaria socialis TaxID=392032 RepID=A0A820VQU7_9BILA|nr:unnamed protein product [Rotaria socialis]
MSSEQRKTSKKHSIIDNDNIKGFFEVYLDQELKGLAIDYGKVLALYLTSVSTQTINQDETPNESFEIKYRKLLEQYEKLEKENQDLTTEIKCLKAKNKKKIIKCKKIKQCAKVLGLDIDLLKQCKGDSSTITCRNVTRELFPDAAERASKTISTIEKNKVTAIVEFARIVHPGESKSKRDLTNAIGNVFASEKLQEQKKKNY